MHRRTLITKLTTGLGLLAGLSLIPKAKAATVKAEVGDFGELTTLADSIPNVDHTPQAHREAINTLLVGLGSVGRPVPPSPMDMRIELPVLVTEDAENVADFLRHVRRALIGMGIAKEPE